MKRLKKLFIALTSIFSVISLFPLSACSGGAMHTLTLVNENEDRGTLSGEGSYKTGSQVTISYTANKGYKFDKWDIDGEQIKISNRIYTFKMPDKDITVKGGFLPKAYDLDLSMDNFYDAGEVIGEGSYDYNSSVTVSVNLNKGYSFNGWYANEECVSTDITYTFTMPMHDYELRARCERISYNVNIVVSDPTHCEAYLSSWTGGCYYNSQHYVSVSYKNLEEYESYKVKGIYDYSSGQKGDLIGTADQYIVIPDHDITIYVEIERLYYVEFYGTVGMSYNNYNLPGTEYVLKAIESDTCPFVGWFDKDDNLISKDSTFTYVVPEHYSRVTGKYNFASGVTFGEYHQDLVVDENLIAELDKITTYNSKDYIEYNGEQYHKEYNHYPFDLEVLPSTQKEFSGFADKYCYYKVKPIEWDVVYKVPNTDISLLLSKYVLIPKMTTDSEMSTEVFQYRTSEIRKYLNGRFLENSFSSEEREKIQTLSVDALSTKQIVDKDTYEGDFYTDTVLVPGASDFDYNATDAYLFSSNEDSYKDVLKWGKATDYSGISLDFAKIYQSSYYLTEKMIVNSCAARDANGSYYHIDKLGEPSVMDYNIRCVYARPMIFVKGL